MITIKLPYKSTDKFQFKLIELRKQYSNIVRYSYNRFLNNLTQKEIRHLTNDLKNIDNIDSWIIQCGIMEANQLYKRFGKDKIVFGGKLNFTQRCKNKISKKEFKSRRLLSLNIQGECLKQGNRKFILDIIENNQIIFKLNVREHYDLTLPNLKNNIKNQLFNLQNLTENNKYTYSIKLDEKYIFISFEEFKTEHQINLLENRYLGIDLNPTNIGISICEYNKNLDEHKILKTVQFDFSKIVNEIYSCKQSSNHKDTIYWNNKLNHEILQISKSIHNLSKCFNCKYIFVEELNFKFQKKEFSKSLNRLVKNLWKRNKFINNLTKRCNINNQKLIEINSAYSSIIGNLQYDYVDSINASVEIGRRGYEIKILKNRDKFYPALKLKDTFLHQWKEMGNVMFEGNWKRIYTLLKNSKLKYRVSLCDCSQEYSVFQQNSSYKSMVLNYAFYD